MRSSTRLYVLGLTLALAGFVYGAATLFVARYSRGDVYPPYSSFRTDPQGGKAFYEALRSVPELYVERNVEPLARVAGNRAITLFVNGLSFDDVGTTELESGFANDLQKVMQRGGRVVISFSPVVEDIAFLEREDEEFQQRMEERMQRRPAKNRGDKAERDEEPPSDDRVVEQPERGPSKSPEKLRQETILELPPKPGSEKSPDNNEQADENASKDEESEKKDSEKKIRGDRYGAGEPEFVTWDEQWGVQLRFGDLERDPATNTFKPETAHRSLDAPLPDELLIRTTLYFEPTSDQWRTLYAYDERAVLIERPLGEGTLVLVADAYPLSNEAMRAERHPDFLAWLAGPNGTIVFDEVTHGVARSRGIVTLMWQYRLQGVVAALILMAALYIWKNGQPLVPPFHDSLPSDAYAYVGKDRASGFTNLLMRGVPATRVLRICLAEWEKSFAHRSVDLAESLRDAKAIVLREDSVPAKQRDLVKAYKQICDAFAKHRLR